jgi:hypothetical protein
MNPHAAEFQALNVAATNDAHKEIEKRSRFIRARDDDRLRFHAQRMFEGFTQELSMNNISSPKQIQAVFRSKNELFPQIQVSQSAGQLPLFSHTQQQDDFYLRLDGFSGRKRLISIVSFLNRL